MSEAIQPGYPPIPPTKPVQLTNSSMRVWIGVTIVGLMWFSILGSKYFLEPATPMQFMGMLYAPMVAALLMAIWWLFFSRVSWSRMYYLPLAMAIGIGSWMYFKDDTINGMMVVFYVLPRILTLWVVWLFITPLENMHARLLGLCLVMILGWNYFALLRFDGTTGSFKPEISWRWEPTSEDRSRAERFSRKEKGFVALPKEPVKLQSGDWPGFRGQDRSSQLKGIKLATNWNTQPPKNLWKHKIGPGWSSFAVVGDRVYTQEQWNNEESVVCYHALTGDEVWSFSDPVRFTEAVAGAGPRATPTFHEGYIYSMGATGILNCIDAVTGKRKWEANLLKDTKDPDSKDEPKVPMWGFSASPLIVEGMVLVSAGGEKDKCVIAYHLDSGKVAWIGGQGKNHTYCSPQLFKIQGVDQVLMITDLGMQSLDPKKGTILWNYEWKCDGPRCVQPTQVGEADILLGSGFGLGLRRLHLSLADDKWKVEEVWKSRAINPYYNDYVIHQGYLYGFDNEFFSCVKLEDGKRQWKERAGYGTGQVLLLPEQNLMLISAESGEVALVSADPKAHKELGRFKAIEGKTWNHPVVAHGRLYIRNGEEVACYELPKE